MPSYRLLIFITGFCSMMYELGLAQLLSSLFGNTIMRYATTLAVYIISMGIGSFLFRSKSEAQDYRLIYKAEMGMSILGMLSPFAFVLMNFLIIKLTSFQVAQTPILILTHVYIALTGFICGYELPILSHLAKIKSSKMTESKVLAWDYSGMFVASLIFPLVFFPLVGIFLSFWFSSIFNIICLFILQKFAGSAYDKKFIWSGYALMGVNLILILTASPLGNFLSEVYSKSL